MCVVGCLITRERSREDRYCVSRFSDSPHLLISSKSRPNGATKIDLAKHTHTAPAVFQGRFPSLCCAPRFIPDFTQFDCFVLLVLSRKRLLYCFALIKRWEGPLPAGYWVTISSTAMLFILRSDVIAQIEPPLRTQTLMKRGSCNITSGRQKSARGLAAPWAHLWCPAPVLPPNSVLCHFGCKSQRR